MPILEIVNQFIENSNISNAFGIDANSFLILISGSFIVGYICLTLYYMVYNDDSNDKWKELNFSEKAIVSLVVGFLSIISSQYLIIIFKFTNNFDKKLEHLFLQLNYMVPFILFIVFSSVLNLNKKYQEMEFIKEYIKVGAIWIFLLNVILLFIILYIIQSWFGIAILTILIIFLYSINKKMEIW